MFPEQWQRGPRLPLLLPGGWGDPRHRHLLQEWGDHPLLHLLLAREQVGLILNINSSSLKTQVVLLPLHLPLAWEAPHPLLPLAAAPHRPDPPGLPSLPPVHRP